MTLSLLRNKHLLALLIVAFITALIITTFLLSAVFHINVWHFMPGKTLMNGYN